MNNAVHWHYWPCCRRPVNPMVVLYLECASKKKTKVMNNEISTNFFDACTLRVNFWLYLYFLLSLSNKLTHEKRECSDLIFMNRTKKKCLMTSCDIFCLNAPRFYFCSFFYSTTKKFIIILNKFGTIRRVQKEMFKKWQFFQLFTL